MILKQPQYFTNMRASVQIVYLWLKVQVSNYNLFIPDENDYPDDLDAPRDPAAQIREQKYATWLYVFLVAGK